jgi:hypothetical protein
VIRQALQTGQAAIVKNRLLAAHFEFVDYTGSFTLSPRFNEMLYQFAPAAIAIQESEHSH